MTRRMNLKDMIEQVYESMEGSEVAEAYMDRHEIESLGVLTVIDDETASLIAERLAPRISGKTVVEIGAGIGLLAMHLGTYAKRVYAIEADPAWSSVFLAALYFKKPKHVSFLFGSADEFTGLRADVALFCTHSAATAMTEAGRLFAPEVIDVYGEIMPDLPDDLMALSPLRM